MVNIADRIHVLLFSAVGSILFYLLSVLWACLFIVTVPQDAGWCLDGAEVQAGEATNCVEFKNRLEEMKYHHNREMANRNRGWVYGQLAAGGLLGWLLFARMPRRKIPREFRPRLGVQAVGLGMAVGVVGPLLLARALPASDTWLPELIVGYANERVQQEISALESAARR